MFVCSWRALGGLGGLGRGVNSMEGLKSDLPRLVCTGRNLKLDLVRFQGGSSDQRVRIWMTPLGNPVPQSLVASGAEMRRSSVTALNR